MKRGLLLICLCLPVFLLSQAPQGLSYQAIAWDKNNLPKANQTITITLNIRALKLDGNIEFSEIQTATTNSLGYFTLVIGEKKVDDFKKINWGSGSKFLEVIIDGVAAGTTQMLSVPYAMYAENTNIKAGTGIAISGNTISNTGDGDNDAGNEIQALQLTGKTLELSKGGGSADLSKLTSENRYRAVPLKVEYESTILSNINGSTITVGLAGTYLIYATAEFWVPDNATNTITQLRIVNSTGGNTGEIVDSYTGTGFFFLNGFRIFVLQANESLSLKFSSLYSNSSQKGYHRNVTIFAERIN